MSEKVVLEEEQPKKKHHVFLWFFAAVQVLFVYMLVSGLVGAGQDSAGLTGSEADGAAVGTSIGVALLVFGWFVVDGLLSMVYGVYKLATHKSQH